MIRKVAPDSNFVFLSTRHRSYVPRCAPHHDEVGVAVGEVGAGRDALRRLAAAARHHGARHVHELAPHHVATVVNVVDAVIFITDLTQVRYMYP